jgi:hypothetical protein
MQAARSEAEGGGSYVKRVFAVSAINGKGTDAIKTFLKDNLPEVIHTRAYTCICATEADYWMSARGIAKEVNTHAHMTCIYELNTHAYTPHRRR